MQFLQQIKSLILSTTLIVCCLAFQADTYTTTTTNVYSGWITTNSEQASNHDVYNIKPRKSEIILGNNFSIFRFKCFLRQHKSLLATQHRQQQTLQLPKFLDFMGNLPQAVVSEDDILIG